MCLLDSLLDAAASKSNSSLRELGCNLVAEFAKWTLKYQTNPTEKGSSTNHQNIESLIRRIQSNSSHSDPYKRLSAINCYDKLFTILREEDSLIDRFIFEIAHTVLNAIKQSYNQVELSREVINAANKIIDRVEKVIKLKYKMLL